MNLSFSIKGWNKYSFEEYIDLAKETGLNGIELHNGNYEMLLKTALRSDNILKSVRRLRNEKIKIACIDILEDISKEEDFEKCYTETKNNIILAKDISCPYIRIHALSNDEAGMETTKKFIEKILPVAEKNNIIILIETVGLFCDSAKLRELLEYFANDNLAALWDMHHPYFYNNEDAETTIKNLGAYVRHVHIKDSMETNGKREYCLIGEGELPVGEMMKALSSVNYSGFITLEWDPKWIPEIQDPEIVFTHFQNYISKFSNPSKKKDALYYNKAHTGKFVWKKDLLIEKTFSDVLDKMVMEFPDQYAFKYTTLDYTRTYSEFRNDVNDFARVLISLGVRQGSHVAVWATNIPQWFIAFWATTKIGAVLVSMNTAYKIHEAEYLLRQSDTHTLIMIDGYRDSNYKEIINELCPELKTTEKGKPLHAKRLPFLRNVITVGFNQEGSLSWEEAMKRKDLVPLEEVIRLAASVDPGDVCNMQYTSGTTGFPKGVMLTHFNVVNNGKCIGDRMDLSTADRMMIQVPMFHCFGMVLSMTAAMTHGTTICPLPYFSPKSALTCINQEHITCFHGVPTMFIAMLEHKDFPKTDFSLMRTGIMAGSPCPIAIMRDVVNKMNMKEITIVYGQTEASPGCTMSSADDPLEVRVGTVGRALPEIECKIINPETGEEMPVGETGEFVARGYNIMKGYYKMPKATSEAIDKDGWLHTGDLGCMTEEGNFRITGRLKDMIIRGGENIYPKEIEEFIYTHKKVKDVQVIGVPDKQYGEEIMAYIILKDGEEMTEAEMKDYILAHMAKHKVPKYIEFTDSFPMNVAGKILKYKMRENAIEKLGLKSASEIETA